MFTYWLMPFRGKTMEAAKPENFRESREAKIEKQKPEALVKGKALVASA